MSELIRVPDIGGEGEVIEILVKEGDRIEAEQSLLTLESDKASMEIPAPRAGVIRSLKVKLGDKLKEGDALLELDGDAGAQGGTPSNPAVDEAEEDMPQAHAEEEPAPSPAPAPEKQSEEIRVPDLGSDGKARVIEILVSEGERISADQSLITLESDKASMEIPSPRAGTVERIAVQLDSEVGRGDLILHLRTEDARAAPAPAPCVTSCSA